MTNNKAIKNLQFDLTLPAGVSVATEEDECLFDLTSRATSSHTVAYNQLSNGAYRVIVSTLSNKRFIGNDGAVMEVTLDIPADMKAGEYEITLSNIELNTTEETAIRPSDVKSKLIVKEVLIGDVNGDGVISVTDVGMLISHILQTNPSGFVEAAADLNGDGVISVTDVGSLITKILTSDDTRVKRREYLQLYGE